MEYQKSFFKRVYLKSLLNDVILVRCIYMIAHCVLTYRLTGSKRASCRFRSRKKPCTNSMNNAQT